MKTKKHFGGFTLVELMIVLVLTVIMISYGLPAYRDFGLRQKISNEGNSMLLDFSYARVTAVKEGRNVVMLSNNGVDWADGWRIFLDDGVLGYDAVNDVLLRESQNRDPSLTYTGLTGRVVFNNLGAASNLDTIIIASVEVANTATVSVASSGMVTVR